MLLIIILSFKLGLVGIAYIALKLFDKASSSMKHSTGFVRRWRTAEVRAENQNLLLDVKSINILNNNVFEWRH